MIDERVEVDEENISELQVLKSTMGRNVGMWYVGRTYNHEGRDYPYSVESGYYMVRLLCEKELIRMQNTEK